MKNPLSLHLVELRYRITYLFFSFFFNFLVATYYSPPLTFLICTPFSLGIDKCSVFIFTELTEGFFTAIQLSFTFALFFTLPSLVYQLYSFFVPSCYLKEQKEINWALIFITVFFFISLFFAWQLVLPKICVFLQQYQYDSKCIQIKLEARIAPAVRWSCTAFFFTTLFFQIPVLFSWLHRKMGNFFPTILEKNRKRSAFLLLMMSSFLSPPDVSIQCALAVTGFLLYELLFWYALINQCWYEDL